MTELICSYYTIAGVSPTALAESPWPFEERVRACAEAGYTGIGIHLRDYRALRRSGFSDSMLRAIVNDHGMRHVEVEFLLNWFADGVAGTQSRDDEETLYQMTEAFGARGMFLTGDLMPGNLMPFDLLQEKFNALCRRAAARGARVGVEPCAWSNISRIDEALRLIERSAADNTGLVLDPWHLYRTGLNYERLLAVPTERILAVQLADAGPEVVGTLVEDSLNSRLLPGAGAAQVVQFLRTLFSMGVEIPLSVEVLSDVQRARTPTEGARVSYDAARMVIDRALTAAVSSGATKGPPPSRVR